MRINSKQVNIAVLLLSIFWLSRYFVLNQIPNVDLDAHFAAGERLWQNFKANGDFQFYDPFWFGGYPAFYFYGWLAHLLAGCFYEILNLFTSLNYQQAARIFLLLNLTILPFNLYLLTHKLFKTEYPEHSPHFWLALSSGILAFWFLNISDSSNGAGLAAALHVGMFSQAIAWNIIILAAVLALSSKGQLETKNLIFHTLLSAALILCHPLTAAFYFIICPLYYLLRFKSLLFPLISLTLASILTSFWWLNFFKYQRYLVPENHPGGKHFIEILLGIGNPNSFNALLKNPLIFNFSYLLILLLILSLILCRNKSALIWIFTLLLFSLAASLLSSLSGVGFAIHIYRFAPLAVLLALPALSVSLYDFLEKYKSTENNKVVKLFTGIILLISFLGSALNPAPEYPYVNTTESKNRYNNEDELLGIIKELPGPKRIFQEYFNDYSIFNFVSPHYISAGLNRLNIETLNGLYTQSSLANRQAATAAFMLGIDFYGGFVETKLDISGGIKLLEELGATHLILTNPNLIKTLKFEKDLDFKDFGHYTLFRLKNPKEIISCQSTNCLNQSKPNAQWQDNYQTLELTNLTPNSRYSINYNYFPTLICEGCIATQSDFEKITIKNNRDTARLIFK